MSNLRVLSVDDHAIFRAGLRHVLHQLDENVEIVEANSLDQALGLAEQQQHGQEKFDLILTDLMFDGLGGPIDLKALCTAFHDTTVVVMSVKDRASDVRNAIQLGASGYIPKAASADVMISALRLILAGGVYLPPTLLDAPAATAQPARGDQSSVLTPRQLEVLALLAEGRSNKAIATELGLSPGTVKVHMTRIFKSLGVSNRTEAVIASAALLDTEKANGDSFA
ncbi:MAG: response regulator transcription factor [Alphaproteobacteria bacterium]|jgi:DNA-binding NarL/FixJ family response regulator|nr:response regulator transcription factor [Alphaproteobacteria bacterium]MDP6875540.1 response regulator transcription factor [Alphaproteobacteria bacterium]